MTSPSLGIYNNLSDAAHVEGLSRGRRGRQVGVQAGAHVRPRGRAWRRAASWRTDLLSIVTRSSRSRELDGCDAPEVVVDDRFTWRGAFPFPYREDRHGRRRRLGGRRETPRQQGQGRSARRSPDCDGDATITGESRSPLATQRRRRRRERKMTGCPASRSRRRPRRGLGQRRRAGSRPCCRRRAARACSV